MKITITQLKQFFKANNIVWTGYAADVNSSDFDFFNDLRITLTKAKSFEDISAKKSRRYVGVYMLMGRFSSSSNKVEVLLNDSRLIQAKITLDSFELISHSGAKDLTREWITFCVENVDGYFETITQILEDNKNSAITTRNLNIQALEQQNAELMAKIEANNNAIKNIRLQAEKRITAIEGLQEFLASLTPKTKTEIEPEN